MVRRLKIPMGVPQWGRRELMCMLKLYRHDGLTSGCEVAKLEKKICNQFGVKYCIATDLGRQAITLSLAALGVKRGDGVVVPSYVCQNAVLPILKNSCIPQFVDIGDDLNISPESFLKAIDGKTRVIIAPHMYGKAAPIEEIIDIANKHGIAVIDDAAQAMGAKLNESYVGTFGDIGIFSFGPFKSVMATRGGVLLTNSEKIYKNISKVLPLLSPLDIPFLRALKSLVKFKLRKHTYFSIVAKRSHGEQGEKNTGLDFSEMAPKSISPMDAAIAFIQIEKLEKIVRRRIALANYLSRLLEECDWLETPGEHTAEHVFVKYVIHLKSRSELYPKSESNMASKLIAYLRGLGIEAQGAYTPLHINEHFSSYQTRPLNLTENVWKKLVCLPINPDMSFSDVRFMAFCIKSFRGMSN
jgi:dTDP-4-amino-4,6-dideoxygalactose transaminase